jgi:hypothetical protein
MAAQEIRPEMKTQLTNKIALSSKLLLDQLQCLDIPFHMSLPKGRFSVCTDYVTFQITNLIALKFQGYKRTSHRNFFRKHHHQDSYTEDRSVDQRVIMEHVDNGMNR